MKFTSVCIKCRKHCYCTAISISKWKQGERETYVIQKKRGNETDLMNYWK
jgi:hypothetical protein